MAYNNYFPATYQPNYYGGINTTIPYYPQMQAQTNQQVQRPQIQQSGFVLVQSEQEARTYPVAPGNSVTFKDERQPYCYVKTMGFNQLDQPIFEKYRLVKEEDAINNDQELEKKPCKTEDYAYKSDLDKIWDEINALKKGVKTHKKIAEEIEDE